MDKYFIKHLVILLILLNVPAFADAMTYDETVKAVTAEQAELQYLYKVNYVNPEELDWLKSIYHDLVYDFNVEKQYIVVMLREHTQKQRLLDFGFIIEPANKYIESRLQVLERILTGAQQAQSSFSVVNGENAASNTEAVVSIAGIPDFPCYETVEEGFSIAQDLVNTYPQLAELIDIGDSWEKTQGLGGYDLLVLKITNTDIQNTKPILFVHSAMHARELSTAALTLAFAKKLLNEYSTNPDVKWVVDRREIHILFHMNPDGRKMAEAGFDKRKNSNTNHCITNGLRFGVDLNRNFSALWAAADATNEESFEYRASSESCSEVFRGPLKGSEPETQAVEQYVRSLFPDNRGPNDTDLAPLDTMGMHIDVHSWGEDILYPWGHTYKPAPNTIELASIAHKLAFFNQYQAKPANGIYLLDGNSESVSYGELGVPQLTFELGTAFRQDCNTFEGKIKPDNLKALLYAAKIAQAPYQLPDGPDIVDITHVGDAYSRVNFDAVLQLSANATDNRYRPGVKIKLNNDSLPERDSSGLRQFESTHESIEPIITAEYSIDEFPTDAGAIVYSLQAVDGVFDTSEEQVEGDLILGDLDVGQHTLYYRAQDSNGQWGVVSAQNFIVKSPLIIQFAIHCQFLRNTCQFFGDISRHLNGSIEQYHWDFGDGTTSSEANPVHIFKFSDTHKVRFTVTDDKGEEASIIGNVVVFVLGEIPEARYQVVCDENSCQFDASLSTDADNNIAEYLWTFPNGDKAMGMITDYVFTSEGTHKVELLVTDQDQLQSLAVNSVSMSPAQIAVTNNDDRDSSGGGGGMSLFIVVLFILSLKARKVV